MSVPLDVLPVEIRIACGRLRDELLVELDGDLVALWVYGAATFQDRPDRLGDVDTHGVFARPPDRVTARVIDQTHDAIGGDTGIEWDSWYILEGDARGVRPPRHALREHLVDHAWALHRAHWLADQYVALFGRPPSDLVQPPSWTELEESLLHELLYVERFPEEGRDDPGHAAFAVWNGCRIIYSLETRNVVVSKRAAARWALDHLPASWQAAIQAAERVYDGQAEPHDASILKSAMPLIVAAARERL